MQAYYLIEQKKPIVNIKRLGYIYIGALLSIKVFSIIQLRKKLMVQILYTLILVLMISHQYDKKQTVNEENRIAYWPSHS